MRIAARDLLGHDDLEATVAAITACAATCSPPPARSPNRWRPLAVIGMGKLGGNELNYASDVDVMFVAEGDRPCRAMARRVLEVTRTSFRVDADLRPQGGAARWCTRSPASRRTGGGGPSRGSSRRCSRRPGGRRRCPRRGLRARGRPSVVGAVVQRRRPPVGAPPEGAGRGRAGAQGPDRPRGEAGRGGIRDIEFAVQLLQLVHGRLDPTLRAKATLDALGHARRFRLRRPADAVALAAAYRFLRAVEHRLQLMDGQQVYAMPADDAAGPAWPAPSASVSRPTDRRSSSSTPPSASTRRPCARSTSASISARCSRRSPRRRRAARPARCPGGPAGGVRLLRHACAPRRPYAIYPRSHPAVAADAADAPPAARLAGGDPRPRPRPAELRNLGDGPPARRRPGQGVPRLARSGPPVVPPGGHQPAGRRAHRPQRRRRRAARVERLRTQDRPCWSTRPAPRGLARRARRPGGGAAALAGSPPPRRRGPRPARRRHRGPGRQRPDRDRRGGPRDRVAGPSSRRCPSPSSPSGASVGPSCRTPAISTSCSCTTGPAPPRPKRGCAGDRAPPPRRRRHARHPHVGARRRPATRRQARPARPVGRGLRAYFQNWALVWERQAMLRARPVAGDPVVGRGSGPARAVRVGAGCVG